MNWPDFVIDVFQAVCWFYVGHTWGKAKGYEKGSMSAVDFLMPRLLRDIDRELPPIYRVVYRDAVGRLSDKAKKQLEDEALTEGAP